MKQQTAIGFPFNHQFFADGNSLIGYRYETAKIASHIVSNDQDDEDKSSKNDIHCGESGCKAILSDESAYTEHYESRHRHVCGECRRSFHSRFILELHVAECHDPFFGIKAEREPSYRCLLPSCSEKLANPQLRKDHMIKSHRFPTDYRFYPAPVKKIHSDKDSMDVDKDDHLPSVASGHTSKSHMPKSVCFGAGSRKGFDRSRLSRPWHLSSGGEKNSGKGKKQGSGEGGDNAMDMSDFGEALP